MCGCLTYTKFVRTFEQNPGISKELAIEKLKTKPYKIVKLSPNVECLVYSCFFDDSLSVVYFKDNKMVIYGKDNKFFNLDTQHKLGLIDKDEYRWQYQMLVEQKDADRLARIQAFSALQNMEYQEKSLINQQKQIDLQNKPKQVSGTVYNYKTEETYDYQSIAR